MLALQIVLAPGSFSAISADYTCDWEELGSALDVFKSHVLVELGHQDIEIFGAPVHYIKNCRGDA